MHGHGLCAVGHVAYSLSGTNCSFSVQTAVCSRALDSHTHISGVAFICETLRKLRIRSSGRRSRVVWFTTLRHKISVDVVCCKHRGRYAVQYAFPSVTFYTLMTEPADTHETLALTYQIERRRIWEIRDPSIFISIFVCPVSLTWNINTAPYDVGCSATKGGSGESCTALWAEICMRCTKHSTALCADILYKISPQSGRKCEK